MNIRFLATLVLAAVVATSSFADEKPKQKKGKKGGNQMVQKLMKELGDAGLSDEQMGKIKEAAASFEAAVKDLRDGGLTPELTKKRATAMKEAREAGVKGKEMQAALSKALNEDELALLNKMQAATTKMKKAVAGVLTKEQMEALPEAARKQLTVRGGGGGKGNKKKKKDAAASN